MQEFKIGDLIEFIPENFPPSWTHRYIGVGFIERIEPMISSKYNFKAYYIYCGKLTKQQMHNFVEIELQDQTVELSDAEMGKLCKKINLQR